MLSNQLLPLLSIPSEVVFHSLLNRHRPQRLRRVVPLVIAAVFMGGLGRSASAGKTPENGNCAKDAELFNYLAACDGGEEKACLSYVERQFSTKFVEEYQKDGLTQILSGAGLAAGLAPHIKWDKVKKAWASKLTKSAQASIAEQEFIDSQVRAIALLHQIRNEKASPALKQLAAADLEVSVLEAQERLSAAQREGASNTDQLKSLQATYENSIRQYKAILTDQDASPDSRKSAKANYESAFNSYKKELDAAQSNAGKSSPNVERLTADLFAVQNAQSIGQKLLENKSLAGEGDAKTTMINEIAALEKSVGAEGQKRYPNSLEIKSLGTSISYDVLAEKSRGGTFAEAPRTSGKFREHFGKHKWKYSAAGPSLLAIGPAAYTAAFSSDRSLPKQQCPNELQAFAEDEKSAVRYATVDTENRPLGARSCKYLTMNHSPKELPSAAACKLVERELARSQIALIQRLDKIQIKVDSKELCSLPANTEGQKTFKIGGSELIVEQLPVADNKPKTIVTYAPPESKRVTIAIGLDSKGKLNFTSDDTEVGVSSKDDMGIDDEQSRIHTLALKKSTTATVDGDKIDYQNFKLHVAPRIQATLAMDQALYELSCPNTKRDVIRVREGVERMKDAEKTGLQRGDI